MMRRLSKWLGEHTFWPWGEREGAAQIWAVFITIILTIVWHFARLDWAILWQGLAGVSTFGLPILAGIEALVKKHKWNPWYWFPVAMGVGRGGIISISIGLIFGWASLF